MNISIIGTGYVGLVTAVCFAKLNHNIICVDTDKSKIDFINKAKSPIYEKGLEQLLTDYKKKIIATEDYHSAIKNSEITFLCVGTPSKKDGDIDLSLIKNATIQIGKILKNKDKWHLIVVKSTILPNTTKDVILPLLESYSGKRVGDDFGLAMNPEFLREGDAINDFLFPDRIVLGSIDEKGLKILKKLYKDFSCPIIETSTSSAEMIKYASNAFLATKISFINEIGNMSKKIDINTYDVADGIGFDKRIGRSFLDSGIGWGGSCFPKDLNALIYWSKKEKIDSNIIQSTVKVNRSQPLKLIEILKKHIPDINGKSIGVLGLAFKPNTDDVRESGSITIVNKLIEDGANIKVYDPKAMDNFKKIFPNIHYCSSAFEVLSSDAVLIATKWNEFKKLDFKGKIVIDGRRLIEAKNAKIYDGVCW